MKPSSFPKHQKSYYNTRKLTHFDILNVILCLFVVFIHVSSEPVGSYDKSSLLYFLTFAAQKAVSFVVPGFIFLSGYKLMRKYKNSQFVYKDFLKGRLMKIYLPYLFAATVYCLYFQYREFMQLTPAVWLENMLLGTTASPFYFIVIIFQFYLLMPLWLKLFKGKPRPVVLLCASLLITLLSKQFLATADFAGETLPNIVFVRYNDRIFISYLLYWVMGCLLAHFEEQISQYINAAIGRRSAMILLICAAVASIHIYISYRMSRGQFWYGYAETLHIAFCALSIAAFLLICRFLLNLIHKLPDFITKLFSTFNALTFDIYLWHCIFVYIIDNHFYIKGITSISQRFLLRFIFVYAVSIALAYLLHLSKRVASRTVKRTNASLGV